MLRYWARRYDSVICCSSMGMLLQQLNAAEVKNPVEGSRYFSRCWRLPFQLQSITASWCISNYTAAQASPGFCLGACTFFLKKLTTFFSVCWHGKNVLKIDSCSAWGCTYKLWITPKSFSPPWGCRCTHCNPWIRLCTEVAYVSNRSNSLEVEITASCNLNV